MKGLGIDKEWNKSGLGIDYKCAHTMKGHSYGKEEAHTRTASLASAKAGTDLRSGEGCDGGENVERRRWKKFEKKCCWKEICMTVEGLMSTRLVTDRGMEHI